MPGEMIEGVVAEGPEGNADGGELLMVSLDSSFENEIAKRLLLSCKLALQRRRLA